MAETLAGSAGVFEQLNARMSELNSAANLAYHATAVLNQLDIKRPADVDTTHHVVFYGDTVGSSGSVFPDRECYVSFSHVMATEVEVSEGKGGKRGKTETFVMNRSGWDAMMEDLRGGNGNHKWSGTEKWNEAFVVSVRYPHNADESSEQQEGQSLQEYETDVLRIYVGLDPQVEFESWTTSSDPKRIRTIKGDSAIEKGKGIICKVATFGVDWGRTEAIGEEMVVNLPGSNRVEAPELTQG